MYTFKIYSAEKNDKSCELQAKPPSHDIQRASEQKDSDFHKIFSVALDKHTHKAS